MIEQHEQLDAALEQRAHAMTPEVDALVELAAEVARTLSMWRLGPVERARLDRRIDALTRHSRLAPWRRLSAGGRVPALVGGAAVTVAALAIGIAVARGRHRQPALAG